MDASDLGLKEMAVVTVTDKKKKYIYIPGLSWERDEPLSRRSSGSQCGIMHDITETSFELWNNSVQRHQGT